MKCEKCGFENKPHNIFCEKCNEKLVYHDIEREKIGRLCRLIIKISLIIIGVFLMLCGLYVIYISLFDNDWLYDAYIYMLMMGIFQFLFGLALFIVPIKMISNKKKHSNCYKIHIENENTGKTYKIHMENENTDKTHKILSSVFITLIVIGTIILIACIIDYFNTSSFSSFYFIGIALWCYFVAFYGKYLLKKINKY